MAEHSLINPSHVVTDCFGTHHPHVVTDCFGTHHHPNVPTCTGGIHDPHQVVTNCVQTDTVPTHHTHNIPCTDGHGHVITRIAECNINHRGHIIHYSSNPEIRSWTFA